MIRAIGTIIEQFRNTVSVRATSQGISDIALVGRNTPGFEILTSAQKGAVVGVEARFIRSRAYRTAPEKTAVRITQVIRVIHSE